MANLLIGKILKDLKIADDKLALLFITDEGEFIAKVDADCCSYTWIESVNNLVTFPAKIIAIEDLDMPDLGSPDQYDVLAYYGAKVTTDKGDIVIDYRNSSNGYYGGSIVWPLSAEEYNRFYGGVYSQNVSKEVWQDIAA